MLKIKITSQYKKDLRKVSKSDKALLNEVVFKLANQEKLDAKYYDHKLKGTLNGKRDCHIKPNLVLVYEIKQDELILMLICVGNHQNLELSSFKRERNCAKQLTEAKFNRGYDFDQAYWDYFQQHKEEFIQSEIDNAFYDDDYIDEIKEDNNLSTDDEVRKYLHDYYSDYEGEVYDNHLEYIMQIVDEYLNDKYQRAFDEADSITDKVIDRFKELLIDKADIGYYSSESHSWSKGKFPSMYFTIDISTEDDAESIDVRLSDMHDNGRNDSDIELDWTDDDCIKGYERKLVNEILDRLYFNLDIDIDSKAYYNMKEEFDMESRRLSKDMKQIAPKNGPVHAKFEELKEDDKNMEKSKLKSAGVYSVLKKKWIKEPTQEEIPDIDEEAFEKLYKEWEDKYFDLIKAVEKLYMTIAESIAKEGKDELFGYINGDLESFDPESFINKCKDKKMSLHTNRLVKNTDNEKECLRITCGVLGANNNVWVDIVGDRWVRNTDYDADDSRNYTGKHTQERILDVDCGEGDEGYQKAIEVLRKFKTERLGLGESIDTLNKTNIEKIDAFIDSLYDLRQKSIAKDGEFGLGNLVFKEMRSKGYLDNLRDMKKELSSKELSLEGMKKVREEYSSETFFDTEESARDWAKDYGLIDGETCFIEDVSDANYPEGKWHVLYNDKDIYSHDKALMRLSHIYFQEILDGALDDIKDLRKQGFDDDEIFELARQYAEYDIEHETKEHLEDIHPGLFENFEPSEINSKDKLNGLNLPTDGTYDKGIYQVSLSSGYQVSFFRPEIKDNEIQSCLDAFGNSCGIPYVGKWHSDTEISYNVDNKDLAMGIAKIFNQESIWDWGNNSAIANPSYNGSIKVEYNKAIGELRTLLNEGK